MSESNMPLAYRMCPSTIDEYVGQEHILSKDKMLYRLIKADRLSSIILWGPPGCGKTSLARVIAKSTKNRFEKLITYRPYHARF
jgi:putative ATPase